MSAAEFSLRERVDVRQVRWWKWRLAQERQTSAPMTPTFAPVVLETKPAAKARSPIEIVLRTGHRLRVRAAFDGETLARVVALLGDT